MTNDSSLTIILYSLTSLAAFFLFYSISKKISGENLSYWKFYVFFALLILWGGNQLSVARYGYMLFHLPSEDFFEINDAVRWVAFISAISQVLCIPTKKNSRRRFSQK